MISERIAWADKDFTCTGLKKPVRAKCGDRRMRTLLYEAANVMLTRYKGQLKVKLEDWAFAIAK